MNEKDDDRAELPDGNGVPAVELRGLTKRYGKALAVDGLELDRKSVV